MVARGGNRASTVLEFERPVTAEQQAIYLNGIPLIALGAIYLAAGASLVPTLLRERRQIRDLELALALVFACGGAAALIFGLLVLDQRAPVGGMRGRRWARSRSRSCRRAAARARTRGSRAAER